MKKQTNRKILAGVIIAVLWAFLLTGCGIPRNTADTLFSQEAIIQKQESGQKAEPAQKERRLTNVSENVKAENSIDEAEEKTDLTDETTEYKVSESTANVIDKQTDEKAEGAESEKSKNVCTLSVRCDTILLNMNSLKVEKALLVPDDGVIFAERQVEFTPGESVFDVLLREMRNAKIHMEFNQTPAHKSAYIEGINNLYEFDCGELSGWMYRVNGEFPNMGCSKYVIESGDKIEWLYTCDRGRDLRGDTAL